MSRGGKEKRKERIESERERALFLLLFGFALLLSIPLHSLWTLLLALWLSQRERASTLVREESSIPSITICSRHGSVSPPSLLPLLCPRRREFRLHGRAASAAP